MYWDIDWPFENIEVKFQTCCAQYGGYQLHVAI